MRRQRLPRVFCGQPAEWVPNCLRLISGQDERSGQARQARFAALNGRLLTASPIRATAPRTPGLARRTSISVCSLANYGTHGGGLASEEVPLLRVRELRCRAFGRPRVTPAPIWAVTCTQDWGTGSLVTSFPCGCSSATSTRLIQQPASSRV
jgi:hypothetical protein